MYLAPLASTGNVADIWRPLGATEQTRVEHLIASASALLRQKLPSIDARMATFVADPTDPSGLSSEVVATVVATVVKRFLTNPLGVTTESKALGGASISHGYSLRGDKDVRGELIVTAADLEKLAAPTEATSRLISFRIKSSHPAPYGVSDIDVGSYLVDGDYPADTWLGDGDPYGL